MAKICTRMAVIVSLTLAMAQVLPAQASLPVLSFERDSNTSATYWEAIDYYRRLAKLFPGQVSLQEHGSTDAGLPLHLAVISGDGDFSPESIRARGKRILFVNNGIHAGEPCEVDASMLLRDLLTHPEWRAYLDRVVLVVIPFYNISGGLNRGSFSRANQNGPAAYGFRGNARNLDLNRDFIKCDSRNAQAFNQLFTEWRPDVFIDNHTSDGADYQYTMTLIASQTDKLDPPLAGYMNDRLLPRLYRGMSNRGWEMTPYVNVRETPDEGIYGFLDLPRYSSGYAALHHTVSFIAEAHMLKPYRDRVMSCYSLMLELLQALYDDYRIIAAARQEAVEHSLVQDTFALAWSLNTTLKDSLNFKGYTAKYKPSAVSGLDRLYYDRNEPYERVIPYYRYYRVTAQAVKPAAYLIPQAYGEVIDRLRWNGVTIRRLSADVEPELEWYYIRNYRTGDTPYEGHYLHSGVELEKTRMRRPFRKGDYVVFVNQPTNRYIVETLEPQGADSFFAWNFFDGILMQKEYFSSYVFEDLAEEYLRAHPDLREELERRKREDEQFARSARAQLDFVYKHSPYYEPTHNLYPVARLTTAEVLPLEEP